MSDVLKGQTHELRPFVAYDFAETLIHFEPFAVGPNPRNTNGGLLKNRFIAALIVSEVGDVLNGASHS